MLIIIRCFPWGLSCIALQILHETIKNQEKSSPKQAPLSSLILLGETKTEFMDCYSSSVSKCIYSYPPHAIPSQSSSLAVDSSSASNTPGLITHNYSVFLLSACGWEWDRGPYMVWLINFLKHFQIAKPFITILTHNKVPSQFSISIFLACSFLPLLHSSSANREKDCNLHSTDTALLEHGKDPRMKMKGKNNWFSKG